VTNLFQLAKKVTILFQIANKSDELIPNGSVDPVPIDKSCRLYSIWHTFELIPNGRVGLVQPPHQKLVPNVLGHSRGSILLFCLDFTSDELLMLLFSD
jgi:hypothetical protein